jgi:hypothetical protein
MHTYYSMTHCSSRDFFPWRKVRREMDPNRIKRRGFTFTTASSPAYFINATATTLYRFAISVQ